MIFARPPCVWCFKGRCELDDLHLQRVAHVAMKGRRDIVIEIRVLRSHGDVPDTDDGKDESQPLHLIVQPDVSMRHLTVRTFVPRKICIRKSRLLRFPSQLLRRFYGRSA